MGRGLRALLESSTFTLTLAVVVLAGGMAYGFYTTHRAPDAPAPASATAPATADAAPATKP